MHENTHRDLQPDRKHPHLPCSCFSQCVYCVFECPLKARYWRQSAGGRLNSTGKKTIQRHETEDRGVEALLLERKKYTEDYTGRKKQIVKLERCDYGTMLAVDMFSTPLSSLPSFPVVSGGVLDTLAMFTLMQIMWKHTFFKQFLKVFIVIVRNTRISNTLIFLTNSDMQKKKYRHYPGNSFSADVKQLHETDMLALWRVINTIAEPYKSVLPCTCLCKIYVCPL